MPSLPFAGAASLLAERGTSLDLGVSFTTALGNTATWTFASGVNYFDAWRCVLIESA